MSDVKTRIMPSFDGTELAIHELGQGRPLLLLHGLFSNAETNWVKFGHAETLADAGFHVIMPDLRAHGQSAAPHEASAYPTDVLVADARFLIEEMELGDFDLGGFSLGARTTAALLSDGVRPRKAILSGMGLEGLTGWAGRREFFLTAIERMDSAKRGDPHWMAIQFMKTTRVDPVAMRHLLLSFPDETPSDFAAIDLPVQILCGREDTDNGNPVALCERLPQGEMTWIDGTHMSCITKPELGEEMAAFLNR